MTDFIEKKMTSQINIIYITALSVNSKKGGDGDKGSLYSCPVYKYPCRTDRYLIMRINLPCSPGGG